MQISANRSLSFTCAALAVLPFGLLGVLLQYTEWRPLAATIANPYLLCAIGFGSIALSVLSYPKKNRSPNVWLFILIASLTMSAAWAVALTNMLPILPMLMYCIPAWQSWRLYRDGDSKRVA